jgi:TolB-like protein/tetratricopeptide (TPR) repeat protein
VAQTLRFGDFDVDLAAGLLCRRGARVRLREQSFQVLAALLERPGEVVSRDELRRRLWPGDVFVDFENNLNSAVGRLREALGDSAERPRFVETLPKRGYRFIGALEARRGASEHAGGPGARVVVLPFLNLSGDAGQEYFADAITDEVITALAGLAPGRLDVIARTTAMRYKGARKDVARIGRELRVDHLVEGAVRREGGLVTVNAQVVRASDQAHVWAKRYDARPAEVFGVPASIAAAVAQALDVAAGSPSGTDAPSGAPRSVTYDPVTYNEYLHGRRHLDGVRVEQAVPHFERAIARDPNFVPAHEGMAEMYWILGYLGVMAPRDAFAAGMLHAVRALEIDGSRAETRALLAHYRKLLTYDWPAIEQELAGALALNPDSSLVATLYVTGWLMPQGRLAEAVALLERALERDPLSYYLQFWLGVIFALTADWERCLERSRLLVELEPASPFGPWLQGAALRGKGLLDESIAAHRRAVEMSGASAMTLGWLGLVLGAGGRTDEARGVLERLEAAARARYVPPTSFAWVYLGLRDLDRAFEWMDRAADAGDQFMMPIKTYVFFDPIRGDPRFGALLRRMNLA